VSTNQMDPQEREAMEAQREKLWRQWVDPGLPSSGRPARFDALFEQTWRAAREYSKQREEKLRAAVTELLRLKDVPDMIIDGERPVMTTTEVRAYIEEQRAAWAAARAALAENGDSDE
jgi:hypothetical protein